MFGSYPHALYLPANTRVAVKATAATELADCRAPSSSALPPQVVRPDQCGYEIRGGGNATRQIIDILPPSFAAERLMVCEVLTPAGNWSSYPPHKHDASAPCEVVNEEIYYYRIAGPDQVTPSRTGLGYHRTYTGPEHEAAGLAPIDETLEVRDHDVVLVPHGYHGPCMAAYGYPMYYLNAMAGPAPERALAFCDDPTHSWVRASWSGVETDPRCPVTSASGRRDGLVPSYAEVNTPAPAKEAR